MAGRLPSCSLLLCTQSGCCRLCGLDVLGVWLEVALSPSTWRVSLALGLCVATVPHLPPHWLPWSRLLGSPSLALRGSAIGLCLLSLPGTFPGGLYAFCMWYVLEDLKAPFPQKPPCPPQDTGNYYNCSFTTWCVLPPGPSWPEPGGFLDGCGSLPNPTSCNLAFPVTC